MVSGMSGTAIYELSGVQMRWPSNNRPSQRSGQDVLWGSYSDAPDPKVLSGGNIQHDYPKIYTFGHKGVVLFKENSQRGRPLFIFGNNDEKDPT